MVIRELLIRLGLTGSDTVGRGLDKVDGKVDKTIQSFSALGGVLATVFGAVTISNIAKTADSMQSFEARIGMLSQTVTDSATAFDEVAKHAADSRQSIDSYATFYLRVGNAAKASSPHKRNFCRLLTPFQKLWLLAEQQQKSNHRLCFSSHRRLGLEFCKVMNSGH